MSGRSRSQEAYASKLSDRLGAMGIDAITRIVGIFVSAMGDIRRRNRGFANAWCEESALIVGDAK